MAYAAVASLSHTIHLLLNYHQQSVSPKFKDQIISLHKHTIFLQSFLEDAPYRANNWEETIREVTDRAEDMIELLLSDSLMESTLGSSKSKRELHYGFNELERVAEEMESIANRVKGGRHTVTMGGSDHELMEIVSRLREGSSSALEVIAFVGMGGMGKTTLARNAYNNPLIVEHFDVRAWSTVSQDYSRREIILDLLCFMNKSSAGSISDSEDELISSVYKILKGKRYLIVLDDIWSLEALKGLRLMLPDDGNGSRIILTTRLYSVAVTAAHTHKMRLMSVDITWDLLRAKIFKGDPCPSQLEHLGKMIAISCRGHPLSIDVVSGILAAADQTEALWEDISENIKIASEVDDILYLSYTYLPHHLRPCFLYLANFPEDHGIPVSKLVKLWTAEGFLNGSESKSYEEIGEEHVEELVQRGLVSISKRKSNGRIKSIIIHNLMRDLCLRQARIDNFILDVSRFGRFDRQVVAMKLQPCRRVSKSIYGNDILEGVYGSTIRTIMLYLNNGGLGVRCSIGNVRLLRILDLSNAYNYDLPEEVYGLFHLRYLAFYCGFSVSEAISNLKNLQTLIICPREEGGMFDNLPEGIWRMPQLRHLFMFLFELPNQKGATPFALENLQMLSRVVDFRVIYIGVPDV